MNHDPRPELLGLEGDATPRSGACRRGFLYKLVAAAAGAIAGLAPFAAGLVLFLDPLRRKGADASFVRVTGLDSVPADGKARLFRVLADRQDAWNRFLAAPVGAVYLRRTAEEPDRIIAFNTVCPHLGCFVDARADGTYLCPCHNSTFKADGSRGEPCVAARGLDVLDARVEDGQILVRFQNFLTGKEEKIPVS